MYKSALEIMFIDLGEIKYCPLPDFLTKITFDQDNFNKFFPVKKTFSGLTIIQHFTK